MQWPPTRAVWKLGPALLILAFATFVHPLDVGAQEPASCLRGRIHNGFSLVSYEGGSVAELEVCAHDSLVSVLWVPTGEQWVHLITGAPDSVNREFRDLYPGGVPANTAFLARSDGTVPPDPYPPLVECSAQAATARVTESVALVRTDELRGTAFYLGSFEWLTAAHVVADQDTVQLTSADLAVTATVIGLLEDADLALLRGESNARAIEWGETPTNGEDALILGYGLGHRTLAAGVTRGIVSERFTEDGLAYIRTDAPANPGNSGGPLVDICGNVIGIVQSKIADLTVEGVAFALTADSIRALLPALRSASAAPRRRIRPRLSRRNAYTGAAPAGGRLHDH